jgi:glutamine amidotransferase
VVCDAMIAIVDYGVGNLRSVEKAFNAVGAEVRLTSDPEIVLAAEKVVLPGVGAFGDGMEGLEERNLLEAIKELVARGTPLLGICLGMQLLFDESEEHGRFEGLGFLGGKVCRFDMPDLITPHTGWNRILIEHNNPLLHGLPEDSYTYFNHGYYCKSQPEDILAYTEYGLRFASVVRRGSIYGAQFHPEKSQHIGLRILRNFVGRCS